MTFIGKLIGKIRDAILLRRAKKMAWKAYGDFVTGEINKDILRQLDIKEDIHLPNYKESDTDLNISEIDEPHVTIDINDDGITFLLNGSQVSHMVMNKALDPYENVEAIQDLLSRLGVSYDRIQWGQLAGTFSSKW